MKKNIDVLVIGAGPTGMMMAAEAARHGLSCRLIDKGTIYQDQSRAVAIQARTMEIFGHLGLADAFLAQGLQVRAANPISRFQRLTKLTFESLQSPYPFVLSIEQAKTEHILAEHVRSFGLEIERGVELVEFDQAQDSVNVTLRNLSTGAQESIYANWVIGCDGAHSLVRKKLDLTFEGKAFTDTFSLADIHIDWAYPHSEVFVFLNAKGVLATIPLPGANRYRLVFQLMRCRNLIQEKHHLSHGEIGAEIAALPTLEEVAGLIREYVGAEAHVKDPVWMANFYINSRMTNTYRKGRVFLAGDAAHIHSPVGGQGMNTGLQDAFNLGWKLAAVHKKRASSDLLDTYDLERRTVGKKLLKATERASFMATLHNPVGIWFRNLLVSTLTQLKVVRSFLVRAISQTAICYPKSSIARSAGFFFSGPKAGMRAPNAPLFFENKSSDLYTMWQGSSAFHLLLFSGSEKKQHNEIAQSFASEGIKVIIIEYGKNDFNGVAHKIYGAEGPCAYIIRPDLYIGYRADEFNVEKLKDYFAQFSLLS